MISAAPSQPAADRRSSASSQPKSPANAGSEADQRGAGRRRVALGERLDEESERTCHQRGHGERGPHGGTRRRLELAGRRRDHQADRAVQTASLTTSSAPIS